MSYAKADFRYRINGEFWIPSFQGNTLGYKKFLRGLDYVANLLGCVPCPDHLERETYIDVENLVDGEGTWLGNRMATYVTVTHCCDRVRLELQSFLTLLREMNADNSSPVPAMICKYHGISFDPFETRVRSRVSDRNPDNSVQESNEDLCPDLARTQKTRLS